MFVEGSAAGAGWFAARVARVTSSAARIVKFGFIRGTMAASFSAGQKARKRIWFARPD
jgi:hypothetical protein